MPTITIPPRVRFALYIASAVAVLVGTYLTDRGVPWWGEAEAKLLAGVVALVNVLAAANVTRTPADTPEVDPLVGPFED